ncbi:MAG: hypothetical protein D6732_02835 [Methanobacteriota archaeon]|nr:MAG: hypothetical protein D6732_02835 [Euryarchaeota archaeon]
MSTLSSVNILDAASPLSIGSDNVITPEYMVRVSDNSLEIDFWMAPDLDTSLSAACLAVKECIKRKGLEDNTMSSLAAAMMIVAASVITMDAIDDSSILASVVSKSLIKSINAKEAGMWKDVVMGVFHAAGRMRDNVKINLQDMTIHVEPIIEDNGNSSDGEMNEETIMELVFPSEVE